MIKAIFLDIDDTILDFNACARQSMLNAFNDFGGGFEEYMFPVFLSINDSLWAKIEKEELTREQLHEVRWNTVFAALGVKLDGVEFEKRFIYHLNRIAVPIDGAEDLLEYLSGKYLLYGASNGPQAQQERRLEAAGMLKYFQRVFTSAGVGHSKPGKDFFAACFAQTGLEPCECVMLGDSIRADISGGKACGMTTVWFDASGAGEDSSADYRVSALGEIKGIL